MGRMIMELSLAERAGNFMIAQYRHVKRRREVNTQIIESTLHTSRDQEPTKLLLEARDLHGAVADYLGRLDTK